MSKDFPDFKSKERQTSGFDAGKHTWWFEWRNKFKGTEDRKKRWNKSLKLTEEEREKSTGV